MTTLALGWPWPEPTLCMASTTFWPSITSPKTVCLPSSHEQGTKVMKNWEPLVLGPALAIESRQGLACLILKFSSANFSPQMDLPPVPLWLVKSPPWAMNWFMMRWNPHPLYPYPFSPVQRALKFSAVLGTTSLQSSKVIFPAGLESMEISKNTLDLVIKKYLNQDMSPLEFTTFIRDSTTIPFTSILHHISPNTSLPSLNTNLIKIIFYSIKYL